MIWRQQYLKRLRRDLDDWAERGLVDPAKVGAIYKAAEEAGGPRRLTSVLAILGVVLLGFAAMSFVAANWAEMSKGLKLAVLGAGMWSAFGIAYWNGRPAARDENEHAGHYADAAVLLGVILFGVAIMLIGQMYHMAEDYRTGLLLWMAGTLAAAWLVPSRAALILAIVLVPVWSGTVMVYDERLHFEFFLAFAPATLLAALMAWRPALHLVTLAFTVWCVLSGMFLMGEYDWPPRTVLTLGTLVGIAVFAKAHLDIRLLGGFGGELAHWGLAGLMVAAFWLPASGGEAAAPTAYLVTGGLFTLAALGIVAVVVMQRRLPLADAAPLAAAAVLALLYPWLRGGAGVAMEWLYAVAYFALSVWCVSYGMRMHDRFAINLGFAAFGAMALYVYVETVGSLLGSAAFFAVGGLLLIGLSIGLERMRRRVMAMGQENDGAAA